MEPKFKDVWLKMKYILDDVEFIAAHNAGFDRTVLHACCERAGLNPPSIPFECTVEIARKTWGIYPTKLSDVCKQLKIPLTHHHALSDAEACAKIVIKSFEKYI